MTMTRVCSSSACPSIHDLGHSACCTGSGSVRTILLLESSGPPTDPFLLPHLPTGLKGLSKFPRAHVFVAVDLDLCALLALFLHFSNAYTRTSPSMVCQSTVGRKEFDRARPYFGLGAFRSMLPEASMTSGQTGPSLPDEESHQLGSLGPLGQKRSVGTAGARSARRSMYVRMFLRVYVCI